MAEDNIPQLCAFCGQMAVCKCSDRIDDGAGGSNITVLRCVSCGKNA
jgi:hypothetical protein